MAKTAPAPAPPAPAHLPPEATGAALRTLAAGLEEALIVGGNTAPIRARISQIEAEQAAAALAAKQAERAAAVDLEASLAATAAIRAAGSRTALAGRLCALAPPPSPQLHGASAQ